MNYSGTIFLHTKVKELKQMDKSTSETVQGDSEKAKVTANIQENIEGIFIFDEVIRETQEMVRTKELIRSGESLIAILINRKEQYIKENSRNLNESKKEQTQQASSNMKEMKKVRNTNKKPSLLKVMFNKLMRRSKNKDKKEINSPNNPIEPSGIENTSLLKQKIGEIFIFDEVIRETQGKELTESGKKVSEYVKNQKNQLIEEMSKEFNESDKASGIENPVSSLINQKLEENFEANQFVQKYEKDVSTHTSAMVLSIKLLKNKKYAIEETIGKINELKKQPQQSLKSMEEVQQVKNTRQNPLSKGQTLHHKKQNQIKRSPR